MALRRIILLAVFCILLPMEWTRVTGCDGEMTLESVKGTGIVDNADHAVANVLILFGSMVWSIISAWLGKGPWPQVLAALFSAYATFHLHFITTFNLFSTTTILLPAWAAMGVLAALTLDAVLSALKAFRSAKQKSAP